MVSKAKEDLPEPERPVITTSLSRGMSKSIFLRLCSRAPRILRYEGMADVHLIANSGKLIIYSKKDLWQACDWLILAELLS
jgi:hypothetical protein